MTTTITNVYHIQALTPAEEQAILTSFERYVAGYDANSSSSSKIDSWLTPSAKA